MAASSESTIKLVKNSIATTDATVTTLSTIMVYPGTVVQLKAYVVGRRTGGASGTAGDAAGYEISATYKNVSGTTSIIGSATSQASEDQSAWDATFSTSGQNVVLQVTGASGNNVNWSGNTTVTIIK